MDTLANQVASLDSEAAALRTPNETESLVDLDIPLEQLSFTEDTRLFVGFVPDKGSGRCSGKALNRCLRK